MVAPEFGFLAASCVRGDVAVQPRQQPRGRISYLWGPTVGRSVWAGSLGCGSNSDKTRNALLSAKLYRQLERGSRNRCPSSSPLHFFPFDFDLEKDRAIANTMSSGQSERTPLLHGRSPSGLASSQPPGQILGDRADTEGPFDDEELAQESHFSAIQDAQNTVDAQASAFLPEGSYFSVHQATGGHQSQLAAVEEAATPSTPERSKSEVILILAALWIGTFLAAADGSIVATILASVGSEFKASKEVDWIGTSYLLSTCSFQPLYGRGADIFVSASLSSNPLIGVRMLSVHLPGSIDRDVKQPPSLRRPSSASDVSSAVCHKLSPSSASLEP